mmetsp:Transcript_32305/g.84526  ORF Transcript_32305/g.84526 Transcript_32305/m.84526 type:complete len:219 (-) Transcript_32305:695-1351(-)
MPTATAATAAARTAVNLPPPPPLPVSPGVSAGPRRAGHAGSHDRSRRVRSAQSGTHVPLGRRTVPCPHVESEATSALSRVTSAARSVVGAGGTAVGHGGDGITVSWKHVALRFKVVQQFAPRSSTKRCLVELHAVASTTRPLRVVTTSGLPDMRRVVSATSGVNAASAANVIWLFCRFSESSADRPAKVVSSRAVMRFSAMPRVVSRDRVDRTGTVVN